MDRSEQIKIINEIFAKYGLRPGTQALAAFNVERVRGYLEKNLGCKQKEVATALNLDSTTVQRAIRKIRATQR